MSIMAFPVSKKKVLLNPYLQENKDYFSTLKQKKFFLKGEDRNWKKFLEKNLQIYFPLSIEKKSSVKGKKGIHVFSYFLNTTWKCN